MSAERAIAYQLIRDAHRRPIFFRLRAILMSWAWRGLRPVTRRMIGKVTILPVAGTCLRPWLEDGDILGFAPGLEAKPGDVVIHETLMEIRAGFGSPARTVKLLGAKQLKIDGKGRQWLCSADGAYPVHPDHLVVGPVVIVARRPGWPWRRRVPLQGINFPIRPAA